MNTGFDTTIADGRPRRPSATIFVLSGLVVVGILMAVVAWIEVERSHVRSARLDSAAMVDRRLRLAALMNAIACVETTERDARHSEDAASLARYHADRIAVERALASLGDPAPGDFQAAGIARLRATVETRFAGTDRVADSGGRERMTFPPHAASLREIELSRAIQAQTAALVDGQTVVLSRAAVRTEAAFRIIGRLFWSISCAVILGTITAFWLSWRASCKHYRLERQALDTLERLRAVFASTSDAIVVVALSGRIEEVNAAAGRLFGLEPAMVVGRDIVTILDLSRDDLAAARRMLPANGTWGTMVRAERIARSTRGDAIPVDIVLGPLPLPDGTRIVASLRDVSERKAAERAKDDFISTISHELRTPLTSVVGALGLLHEGTAGALPDAVARLVDIAEKNARRLIRLVNDILDIDRLGSGRMTLDIRSVDLAIVAIQARDGAEGLAAGHGVRLAIDTPGTPVMVLGDAERLLQVIGNLLSNAIRFSPPGGLVTLAVDLRESEAQIRVEDQGPGVPPEFRDRLFGRFIQSRAGAAIPGGTGLGLAISREIVQAHKGDIWYADRPGGGARFCVSLPAEASDAPDTRRRLLLCEDDVGAAALLRKAIEEEGYIVDRCGSAREALTMARSGRYDALLLDLALPDAEGLGAIHAMRGQPGTERLPMIVVSASAGTHRLDPAAAALGVVDWIDKPVDRARLLRAIGVAIDRADGARPVLLHVENDAGVRAVVALALAEHGRILQAGSLASARALIATCAPAAAILDIDLPDGSGLELVPMLAGGGAAPVPVVVYTAQHNLPPVGDGIDAVIAKSADSPLVLSAQIGSILARGSGRGKIIA